MKGRIAVAVGDLAEVAVDAVVLPAEEVTAPAGAAAGEGPGKGRGAEAVAGDAPDASGGAGLTAAGALAARFAIRVPLPARAGAGSEEGVRSAFRAALALARERGLATLAVGALGAGPGGLSLRRSAEILLEEARRHLAEPTTREEVRFVVRDEQALRVFEGVLDSVRIAEQMERLARR